MKKLKKLASEINALHKSGISESEELNHILYDFSRHAGNLLGLIFEVICSIETESSSYYNGVILDSIVESSNLSPEKILDLLEKISAEIAPYL